MSADIPTRVINNAERTIIFDFVASTQRKYETGVVWAIRFGHTVVVLSADRPYLRFHAFYFIFFIFFSEFRLPQVVLKSV